MPTTQTNFWLTPLIPNPVGTRLRHPCSGPTSNAKPGPSNRNRNSLTEIEPSTSRIVNMSTEKEAPGTLTQDHVILELPKIAPLSMRMYLAMRRAVHKFMTSLIAVIFNAAENENLSNRNNKSSNSSNSNSNSIGVRRLSRLKRGTHMERLVRSTLNRSRTPGITCSANRRPVTIRRYRELIQQRQATSS